MIESAGQVYFTQREVHVLLGVPMTTIDFRCRDGTLRPVLDAGRRRLFCEADVRKLETLFRSKRNAK